MKQFILSITVSLFSTVLFASTDELDRDFAKPSVERARLRLPKTLVMRVSESGEVAVAHLDKVLAPENQDQVIQDARFAQVEPEKAYKQTEFMELDTDLGRESWYYYYRPFIPAYNYNSQVSYYPYYPTYFYGGAQYNYYPYYSYNVGGFYYYYYGW